MNPGTDFLNTLLVNVKALMQAGLAVPDRPRYQKGATIGGRYLVHQALQGGMSEVYLCLDLQENTPLALKTFQEAFLADQRVRSRFRAECRAWIALGRHPNIVYCASMQLIDNLPFLFMEWVANEDNGPSDLRSRLLRGPIPLRSALDLAIDVCRGLTHAQRKLRPGIVHRDLKPSNILISLGRLAKIADFGLAKITGEATPVLPTVAHEDRGLATAQLATSVVGTWPYMALEQWRGEEPDTGTDIYAIGCILYEMIARRPPFLADSAAESRRLHLEAPVPQVNDQDCPSGIGRLLTRCLAKKREDRFPTTTAL